MKLGNETVTVLRAGLVRSAGGTGFVLDWAHATETSYSGCNVQPLTSTEQIQDRLFAESHLRILGPFALDVLSTDRVRRELTGVVYEADGDGQQLRDLHSRPHHAEVLVKIMTG